jgi:hypothetical protein
MLRDDSWNTYVRETHRASGGGERAARGRARSGRVAKAADDDQSKKRKQPLDRCEKRLSGGGEGAARGRARGRAAQDAMTTNDEEESSLWIGAGKGHLEVVNALLEAARAAGVLPELLYLHDREGASCLSESARVRTSGGDEEHAARGGARSGRVARAAAASDPLLECGEGAPGGGKRAARGRESCAYAPRAADENQVSFTGNVMVLLHMGLIFMLAASGPVRVRDIWRW